MSLHHASSRTTALAACAAAAFAILVASACRSTPPAFASSPGAAFEAADQLFESLARRFTNVQRSRKFAYARSRIGRHALSPSGIWNDSLVWTAHTDALRTLEISGNYLGTTYLFADRTDAAVPSRLGDARHRMVLRRTGEGEYDWIAQVDHAIGTLRAADADAVVGALMRAGAAGSERELRADYRAAFPRTTATLGRLLTLDTLRTVRHTDGSASITLGTRIRPGRLRATAPNFAAYVDKYVLPTTARLTLTDASGVRYLDAHARDGFIRIRLRTHDGRFVALGGAAVPMPDTLKIRMDFVTRILVFNVGFTNLVGDFITIRDAHEIGWHMRFRREPEWELPLATRHLIRAPLQYPFAGEGALLRLSILDAPGRQSFLTRDVRFGVRESAIVRWLGGLGYTAMEDFIGKSELEENRFNADVLAAIRSDLRALAGGPAPTVSGGP